jgi:isopentenyl diphosphate isomerase/L-lactate dehydrogenase-like FMN-dependent dehydrogenase
MKRTRGPASGGEVTSRPAQAASAASGTPSWQDAINAADFEALAAEILPAGPLGYYAGGAGDERTLRDNRAAYDRHHLRPRVLVDVEHTSTATSVLGTPVSMPLLIAPTALQGMAHPDRELATARAAAAAGTVFTLSTLASSRPQEIAAAAPPAPRWFQIYMLRDRAVTRALCAEAAAHAFSAFVLTVDAPVPGRRERDLRTGFRVPPEVDMPAMRAVLGDDACPTVQEFFHLVDPGITWDTVAELADELEAPLVLKGIQTPEDAELACEHGAAAIVVSNHGGRQLDGTAATIDLLEPIVDAVGGRIEVYVDGGVRRGTDVVTALALGARAVLIGRPVLWALACGGEPAVARLLDLLRAEIGGALSLLGAPSPAQVTRRHVAP